MAKPGKFKIRWSKKDKDILFEWGDGAKDGSLFYYFFCCAKINDKTLVQSLTDRGYDLRSLRLSIEKLPEKTKDPSKV